jgi:hypothetical protein
MTARSPQSAAFISRPGIIGFGTSPGRIIDWDAVAIPAPLNSSADRMAQTIVRLDRDGIAHLPLGEQCREIYRDAAELR